MISIGAWLFCRLVALALGLGTKNWGACRSPSLSGVGCSGVRSFGASLRSVLSGAQPLRRSGFPGDQPPWRSATPGARGFDWPFRCSARSGNCPCHCGALSHPSVRRSSAIGCLGAQPPLHSARSVQPPLDAPSSNWWLRRSASPSLDFFTRPIWPSGAAALSITGARPLCVFFCVHACSPVCVPACWCACPSAVSDTCSN